LDRRLDKIAGSSLWGDGIIEIPNCSKMEASEINLKLILIKQAGRISTTRSGHSIKIRFLVTHNQGIHPMYMFFKLYSLIAFKITCSTCSSTVCVVPHIPN
jgi:hypothetical protein